MATLGSPDSELVSSFKPETASVVSSLTTASEKSVIPSPAPSVDLELHRLAGAVCLYIGLCE